MPSSGGCVLTETPRSGRQKPSRAAEPHRGRHSPSESLSTLLPAGRAHTALQPRTKLLLASQPPQNPKISQTTHLPRCAPAAGQRCLPRPCGCHWPGSEATADPTSSGPADPQTHRPFGAPGAEPGSGGGSGGPAAAAAFALRKCRRSGPAGSAAPRPPGRCPGPQLRALRAAPVRGQSPGGRSSPAARRDRAPCSMAAAGGAL